MRRLAFRTNKTFQEASLLIRGGVAVSELAGMEWARNRVPIPGRKTRFSFSIKYLENVGPSLGMRDPLSGLKLQTSRAVHCCPSRGHVKNA